MGLRRSFKPTNLLVNGNGVNGATGWTAIDTSAFTVSADAFRFTASATNGRIEQVVNVVNGHRYAIFANIQTNSVNVRFSIAGVGPVFPSGGGAEERLVSVFAWPASTEKWQFQIRDQRIMNWNEIVVKKCMLFDLTSLLPADLLALSDADLKTWCASNIPYWFDGTLTGGKMGGIGGLK